MVEMSAEDYEKRKTSLAILHEIEDGIVVERLCGEIVQKGSWLKTIAKFYSAQFFPLCQKIFKLVRQADVIHSGISDIAKVPVFMASLLGVLLKNQPSLPSI